MANPISKSVGADINFWSAEAFRLLRTNLDFSFPDITGCQVIGVTSAAKGEGKSTTAANLAYAIAQTGKKVLLAECDLRLPTLSTMMNLSRKPGFTNLVMGNADGVAVLQSYNGIDNFRVITSGDLPPNPTELLGSHRTEMAMNAMKNAADILILDLPPVNVVPDALILSKYIDGMIVVTRRGFSTKKTLNEAIRKLEFVNAKILGFVMTDTKRQDKYYEEYKAKTRSKN